MSNSAGKATSNRGFGKTLKTSKVITKAILFSIIKQMLTNLPSHQNTLFGEQVFEPEEKKWLLDSKPKRYEARPQGDRWQAFCTAA